MVVHCVNARYHVGKSVHQCVQQVYVDMQTVHDKPVVM